MMMDMEGGCFEHVKCSVKRVLFSSSQRFVWFMVVKVNHVTVINKQNVKTIVLSRYISAMFQVVPAWSW